MSNITTLIARACALVGATVSLAAHAGDITPESLALMAAPWGGPAKVLLDSKAEQAKTAVKTAAASEPYDYDPPAGGWHVPGTPIRPAKISVAAR